MPNNLDIITYGSLRKGEYNFDRFPGMIYNSTQTITGYKLYSLGSYPGVKPTGDINDVLIVDHLTCPDQETKDSINRMERGAGYAAVTLVLPNGESGEFYPYLGNVEEKNLVPHGDWTKRQLSNEEYIKEKESIKEEEGSAQASTEISQV